MKHMLLMAAVFFMTPAQAQNTGTVNNHGFAIGKGPGTTGFTSVVCGAGQLPIGQSSADPACKTLTGDMAMDANGVTTIGSGKANFQTYSIYSVVGGM
jgi:hypothetical protein